MNIETLENGDRKLELSEYERDILVRVAKYLRDHYDELDFSARNFTFEQVHLVLSLLNKQPNSLVFLFTLADIKLMKKVFREVSNLIKPSLLDENEDLENISSDLFNMLFDNLKAIKNMQEVTS